MQVLIVTFQLEGMTEAEYLHGCDEDAPAFAAIPGLISKVWLADAADNVYGGVYTFRDAESLEDYLSSDLFAAVKNARTFVGHVVRRYDVLAGPTRITHGLATQPA